MASRVQHRHVPVRAGHDRRTGVSTIFDVTISRERSGRPASTDELATAVGHLVLEASQCEDTLGELVLEASGNHGHQPDHEWWTSGERLANAVAAAGTGSTLALADEYRALAEGRNLVVHGLWLESPEGRMVMKRTKSSKKDETLPGFGYGFVPVSAIDDLADRFNALEKRASDIIGDLMGLHERFD